MYRTFLVPGICCNGCRDAIERAVVRLPGVTSVDVDVARKIVRVLGTTGVIRITEALARAGYQATGMGLDSRRI